MFYSVWWHFQWNCLTSTFSITSIWGYNWLSYLDPKSCCHAKFIYIYWVFFSCHFCCVLSVFYVQKHITFKYRQFYLLLSNLEKFYTFLYLNSCTRTCTAILNWSSKNDPYFLTPDLTGKAFSLSLLSMMLAVGFAWILMNMWTKVILFLLYLVFLSWKDTRFCQIFFLGRLGLLWFWPLIILTWWITLTFLHMKPLVLLGKISTGHAI